MVPGLYAGWGKLPVLRRNQPSAASLHSSWYGLKAQIKTLQLKPDVFPIIYGPTEVAP
jgi:hypothetical protein